MGRGCLVPAARVRPGSAAAPHSLSTRLNHARLLHTPVQVSLGSGPCLQAASQDPGHRPALPAQPGPQPQPESDSQVPELAQAPAPALLGEQGYSQDLGHPSAAGRERGVVWSHSRVRSVPLNSGTRGHLGRGGLGASPLHEATPPSQPLAAAEQRTETATAAGRDPGNDP